MKKRKLKKSVIIIFLLIIILIISSFYGIKAYKQYKYEQTTYYKLLVTGYNDSEIKLLEKNFNDDYLKTLINQEKNTFLLELISEQYFIKNKLDDYLAYYKENKKITANELVTIINTKRNYDYYESITSADTSKDYLMLVNKYHQLKKDYHPDNLLSITSSYAWGTNKSKQIRSDVFSAYLEMYQAIKSEKNITLMINSAYRDYKSQESIYNARKESKGIDYADSLAARPGSSEHQTGLALDIFEINNSKTATFKDSEAYKWLVDNSYKYGFILRYPSGKENITGYAFEAWHYRYVGTSVATYIYEKNITFDEYYAFYLDK